jgi:hypothetical protein
VNFHHHGFTHPPSQGFSAACVGREALGTRMGFTFLIGRMTEVPIYIYIYIYIRLEDKLELLHMNFILK